MAKEKEEKLSEAKRWPVRIPNGVKLPSEVRLDFVKFWEKTSPEIKRYVASLEKRLGALSPRQLRLFFIAAAITFMLLGAALGRYLAMRQPPPPSGSNSSSSISTPQSITRTGVLRRFKVPQDKIEFYLEEQDGTKVLLDFAGKFDSSFLQDAYVDTFVTIEGMMTKSADGTKEILQVEKIVFKY